MKPHIALALILCLPATALADPIKIAGTPIEIVFSQLSDRTIRTDILPLDAQGRPKPTPASTILEPVTADEKLRLRDVTGTAETNIATVHITLTLNPVTLTFHKTKGSLLQQLTFKEDGSFSFRTEAPTFGLGEGRQQFDRRGFFYNFVNGQNTLLATHGGTIPIPFLIGSDGWGMFIHNPPPASAPQPNTAWGQFELRGEDVPYLTNADPQTQWITCPWNDAAKTLSLDPDPRMKNWPANQTRTFQVKRVNENMAKSVDFTGQHLQVQFP